MEPPLLRARDAARRFGRRAVFVGLDIDLVDGERLFLGGPNGSGKSTLLRCLAGTLTLSSGSMAIDGSPPGSRTARSCTGVCLSPEQALYARLSGHDNLLFAARLRMPERLVAAAVHEVEDELGIGDFAHRLVRDYSSGMCARVTAARALLARPRLLLLDEPSRSLDDGARNLLWAALERRSVACVIASHHRADRDRCHRTIDLAART